MLHQKAHSKSLSYEMIFMNVKTYGLAVLQEQQEDLKKVQGCSGGA